MMKSVFKWKSSASRLEKKNAKKEDESIPAQWTYVVMQLIHISTIHQTLVKAFGNAGCIMQGWEIPLSTITILKTLESIEKEGKQIELHGKSWRHDCWVEKQLLKNTFLDVSQRRLQAGEAAYSL